MSKSLRPTHRFFEDHSASFWLLGMVLGILDAQDNMLQDAFDRIGKFLFFEVLTVSTSRRSPVKSGPKNQLAAVVA